MHPCFAAGICPACVSVVPANPQSIQRRHLPNAGGGFCFSYYTTEVLVRQRWWWCVAEMAALCLASAASVQSAFYSNFSIVLFLLLDIRDSIFCHTTASS